MGNSSYFYFLEWLFVNWKGKEKKKKSQTQQETDEIITPQ